MSARDVRTRRVSGRQLDLLWEYLNSHRDIASTFNRSLQAKEYATRKWKEVAELLNAQGEGAHKDWKAWSKAKYWVDYKAKLKKRASLVRSTLSRTGGGPATEPPLSEIEKKILQVVGEDFAQGLPGVRVEPFPEPVDSTPSCSVQDSPASLSNLSILVPPFQPELHDPQNPQPNVIPDINLPILFPLTPPRAPTPASEPVLPTPAHDPGVCTPARPSRTPRRRRREPPMSNEAARRALVQSSQIRAEAAERSCRTLENIGKGIADMSQQMLEIRNSHQRIESYMAIHGAAPRAAE